jgi:hypothetical protein
MRKFTVLVCGATLAISGGGVTHARDFPNQGSVGARMPMVLSCGGPDHSTWKPAGYVPQPALPADGKHRKVLTWCTQQAASLPGLFATQSRDIEWVETIEQQLQSYLETEAPQAGIRVQSVQCRYTVCRIQALVSGPADANNWHQLVASMEHEMWWKFWLTSVVLDRGSGGWTTTLMLRRVSPSVQIFVDRAPAAGQRVK